VLPTARPEEPESPPSEGISAGKRRLGKAERRALVLDAALTVIARKGLDETRTADIGEQAGMSAGHVMYYFRSKPELLMQALQWSEDRFLEDARSQITGLATARDRLWLLVELSVPEADVDPGWILWLETRARAPHDQRVARFQGNIERRWTDLLASVIREGQQAGEFADLDADDFAVRLSALIDGLAIRVLGGAGQLSRSRLLEICAEYIAAQLLVPAAPASRAT
jgi:AcrR family transcriptional regulator